VRCELACLPHAYLTTDLWINRIMASFQAITVQIMKTTAKAIDVNDILVDVLTSAAIIISTFAIELQ